MTTATNSNWSTGNTSTDIMIILMLVTALMILGVAILLLKVIKFYMEETKNPTIFATPEEKEKRRLEQEALRVVEKQKPTIWTKIMELKPIDQEKDLVMDHQFDGIEELDNPIPAWFKVLFYTTIVFAICYLLNYHVFNQGNPQETEYAASVEQAATDKEAFLANPANASANKINESNIVQSKDAAVLKSGGALFSTHCPPCHGEHAQGIVGPNLTDKYWLHGGTIKDVFKTIKLGVPEKGMISWEKTMNAQQISDIANYVLSLQGTNPAGAKAPQGNKE